MRLIVHPQAVEEAREARLWYEDKSEGLGAELMSRLDTAISQIMESPERWPAMDKT